jgi:allantoinase
MLDEPGDYLPGWISGEDFFTYLTAFDQLHREGEREPKMMSIGLHPRLVGRPGRADALARFMDYVQRHDTAWVCRRLEIAPHWMQTRPDTSG